MALRFSRSHLMLVGIMKIMPKTKVPTTLAPASASCVPSVQPSIVKGGGRMASRLILWLWYADEKSETAVTKLVFTAVVEHLIPGLHELCRRQIGGKKSGCSAHRQANAEAYSMEATSQTL